MTQTAAAGTASMRMAESAVGAPSSVGGKPRRSPSPRGGPARGRARRLRLRSWVLLGAGGIAAGVWWLGWHSSVSSVSQVRVAAPPGISEQAVRAASGLTALAHVPAVSPDQVRIAVMTAIPAVADVKVNRQLPDTISLVVSARKPFAAVVVGRGYMVVDDQGIAFDRVDRPRGLPVVDARRDDARVAALQVLAAMPKKLRRDVAKISARNPESVTIKLADGVHVKWGSPADGQLKSEVLQMLRRVNAKEYDVSTPLLPTSSGVLIDPSGG